MFISSLTLIFCWKSREKPEKKGKAVREKERKKKRKEKGKKERKVQNPFTKSVLHEILYPLMVILRHMEVF